MKNTQKKKKRNTNTNSEYSVAGEIELPHGVQGRTIARVFIQGDQNHQIRIRIRFMLKKAHVLVKFVLSENSTYRGNTIRTEKKIERVQKRVAMHALRYQHSQWDQCSFVVFPPEISNLCSTISWVGIAQIREERAAGPRKKYRTEQNKIRKLKRYWDS